MEKPAIVFLVVVLCVYSSALMFSDWLRFPPIKDEESFQESIRVFSLSSISILDKLNGYRQGVSSYANPMTFMMFGALQHFLNEGITTGRMLNLMSSLLIVCIIGFRPGGKKLTPALSAFGLMLFPYFWMTSILIYTDIIAAFFCLAGVIAYRKGMHMTSCVSFILAISCRQSMVAFPAALAVIGFIRSAKKGLSLNVAWMAPALATLTVFGWFFVLGTVGQDDLNPSITPLFFGPKLQNSLYFLSCVGFYYTIPEFAIFNARKKIWKKTAKQWLIAGLIVAAFFLFFPPLGNESTYDVNTMGLLDIAGRLVLADGLRVSVFCLFALLAVVRFADLELPLALLVSNAFVTAFGIISWDKYILPLLVVLWYLKSEDELEPVSAA